MISKKPQLLNTTVYFIIHMTKIISSIEPHELDIISLYLSDYNRKIHLREIARLLNANHRTIALTLQKLERKNIMSSEVIGKNKFYSLNLDNISTKEYITCTESVQKMKLLEKYFIFKKLVTQLSASLESNTITPSIILFGSYAKGTGEKESDIDLLLFKDKKENELTIKIKEFAKQYNKTIQIQQATREQFEAGLREKDPLVIEIVNHHILLSNNQFFIEMLWRYAHER